MRKTETYQETSKLGPFAFVALGIHGAAILFGFLGTPPEKSTPSYEILVDWEAPAFEFSEPPHPIASPVSAGLEEPKLSQDEAPSFAPMTTVPVAAAPALNTTVTVEPEAEGSAQVAFNDSLVESSAQPDSGEDTTLASTQGLTTGASAAGGGSSGKARSRKIGSDGVTGHSTKGHQANHRATLVAQSPCTDLFPYGARISSATVAVKVDVDPDGKARLSRVLSGLPPVGGFGAATMACSARLRFEPARDASGAAVTSQAVVRLHFDRNG